MSQLAEQDVPMSIDETLHEETQPLASDIKQADSKGQAQQLQAVAEKPENFNRRFKFQGRRVVPAKKKVVAQQQPSNTSLHTHIYLPYIIMGYIQLFVNAVVFLILLYLLVQCIFTIQRDVEIKVYEHSQEIQKEIALCAKNYIQNQCDPATRLPAMHTLCESWYRCSIRDPRSVARAKVSAETFAEILNSFIEPISYKTMASVSLGVFIFLLFSNVTLSFARSRFAHGYNAGSLIPQSGFRQLG